MDGGSFAVDADYCTAWPDALFGIDYRWCCFRHDWDYALGVPKFDADIALAQCVADAGLPLIGVIMFLGVTLFGWLFYRKRR